MGCVSVKVADNVQRCGGLFRGMFQWHNRNPMDSKQHGLAHFVHFGKCNADETMDSHPPRP
ncbi:MAG: hypothetical protein WCL71_09500, partial [Deltaproteobacteria bacterium]